MKEQASALRQEAARQLREVLETRALAVVFQPIFHFGSGTILGHEALVRGPPGSLIHSPVDLFRAAADAARLVELNIVCVQEALRTYARHQAGGDLFLNISPQLILQPGFSQDRARRFMASIGLQPERVVIELTEDYPTSDFRLVRESLALYRAIGFRVAIDDLGEGFASLRLWSELRPEFVKADKHFVSGIARDAVKGQFLRAIQHIAENCGSRVIAEGIESAEDFKVVKDVGIACGQGWFVGHPAQSPSSELAPELAKVHADPRLPVVPTPRLRAGAERTAQDFLRSVDAVTPQASLADLLARFAAAPRLAAIPVAGTNGIVGVVSRAWLAASAVPGQREDWLRESCLAFADPAPIRVESDLPMAALAAILVESDAQRLADGFVITSRGRYLGMGQAHDVMRGLQDAQVFAARYTSPLTMLPGQVPINEHLERLLGGRAPFFAWYVEVDQMRGFNDGQGFAQGDALLHDCARLLESIAEPGLDFVGHVAGSRFVVWMQSEDAVPRAERALAGFAGLLASHVAPEVRARGYFAAVSREGREDLRPLPRLVIGMLPVLPGVFESRHEVLATAKLACRQAKQGAASALHVDHYHGNAYPHSLLFPEPD